MIKEYNGHKPHIHNSCFIAENTTIIGRVTIKRNASIWYGTVIRGDDNYISIGENTNVQDNCTIHIAEDYPTIIGDNVTIGHGAIVHGCKVGNNVLIGMGAIILDGAEIEDNVLIAAGSLVSPGKKMPSNTLVMGSPAKVVRELTKEEIVNIKNSADYYVKLAEEYKKIGL
ncbi:MAG: gamma carbonic anhydrase family protein [Clostridiales bacterium]|jgi:carbonic anhydrase/acetyltransferase-like protein (isoleucine patch superfamily)|nr:gamma carbonic anhydrase family protein [Clostridiales bacterium]